MVQSASLLPIVSTRPVNIVVVGVAIGELEWRGTPALITSVRGSGEALGEALGYAVGIPSGHLGNHRKYTLLDHINVVRYVSSALSGRKAIVTMFFSKDCFL